MSILSGRPDLVTPCHNTLEKEGFQPARFRFRHEGVAPSGGATREVLVSRSHPFETRTCLGLALGLGPPRPSKYSEASQSRFSAAYRQAHYFRIPRNPSRVDAQRGDHFLQADFSLPIRMSRSGLLPVGRQSVRNLGHHFPEARFWRASGSATRRPNEAIILGSRCRAEVLPSPSRYRLMQ